MNTEKKRPMTAAEERTMRLTLQEISSVFHMPLHEACVQLQADEPTLKKRYRELGINAWPYRKRYKFDDPNIESLVRNAMTKGTRPLKKLSPDTPKSPSLFGNFILATKKKSKKEEEEEQFHGSTASPVDSDTTMSEQSQMQVQQNWDQRSFTQRQQPQTPSPQKYTPNVSPNTSPPQQWSQYNYPSPTAPVYQPSYYPNPSYNQPQQQHSHSQYYSPPPQQHHQQQFPRYMEQPMYNQSYNMPHNTSPQQQHPQQRSPPQQPHSQHSPQHVQQQQLPSIQELLNTAPPVFGMQQQGGRQTTKHQQYDKERRDIHQHSPQMERGYYSRQTYQ